jgi:hypothetical protein
VPKDHREHVEKTVAHIHGERREAAKSIDVDELLAAYRSPDPRVRAKALHESCPCHVPWEIYEQLRKPALRLRRDPDRKVRQLANHLEEDASAIEQMEASLVRYREVDELLAEKASARSKRVKRRRR